MDSRISALLLIMASFTLADNIERHAVVVISGPSDTVTGNVTFTQLCSTCPVTVEGRIEGLTPGLHGFHVHETGDLTEGCTSALGHFNLEQVNHGGPTAEVRHTGDLGNIEADSDGIAIISITDSKISLVGSADVLGRAVVIHADEDDLGLGGYPDSLTTGHAGARIACGVIGLQ